MMVMCRRKNRRNQLAHVTRLLMLFVFPALCRARLLESGDMPDLTVSARVVGGFEVDHGRYPWFVRLDSRGTTKCGGTLVAKDVVLTAAHCYNRDLIATINGYAALTETNTDDIVRRVVRKYKHPEFDEFTFAYDYMLLFLEKPVEEFEPVKMNWDESIPRVGDKMAVIGLGSLEEGGPFPKYLHQANVTTTDTSVCRENYQSEGISYVRPDIMFCAKGPNTDGCQGDSGGPILNQEGVQVGIVSFGLGCARPKFPGVYARLAPVRVWIERAICRMSIAPPDWCAFEDGDTRGSLRGPLGSTTPAPAALAETPEPIPTSPPRSPGWKEEPPSPSPNPRPLSFQDVREADLGSLFDWDGVISMKKRNRNGGAQDGRKTPGEEETTASSTKTADPVENTFDENNLSDSPSCSICGEGSAVTNLDIVLHFKPHWPPMSCAALENAGKAGFISPQSCAVLSGMVGDCECAPTGIGVEGSAPSDPPADVESVTTPAPASDLEGSKGEFSAVTGDDAATEGGRGPGVCDDYLDRTFSIHPDREPRDCIWLQTAAAAIRKRYCKPGQPAYDVCEETCGKCTDACADEASAAFLYYPFNNPNGEPQVRKCAWLRSRPNARKTLCVEGTSAYFSCPETCNGCAQEQNIPQPSTDSLYLDKFDNRESAVSNKATTAEQYIKDRMQGMDNEEPNDSRKERLRAMRKAQRQKDMREAQIKALNHVFDHARDIQKHTTGSSAYGGT